MSQIAQQAERLCAENFTRIAPPSKYIAGFSSRLGRQLALELNRQAIYCWSQPVPLTDAPTSPIRTYAENKSRNSNLNGKNSPNLVFGRPAHYWKFEDTSSFQTFLNWYGQLS